MFQTSVKQKALLAACTIVLGFGASGCATRGAPAAGAASAPNPYVVDSRGAVVKDPFGLCWRTGFWTPALATCECDKDILPKERCAPPAPKPAAAPAPAPAPVKPAPAPAPVAPAPAPAPKPAPAPLKPVTEKVTLAADVLFDFDRATLKPEGKAKLDDLTSKLKAVALEVIIAIGHTDRLGGTAYNQRLSVKRAEAVKSYLVSQGVEPNRIYTEGKGKAQPIKNCPDPAARGQIKNRAELISCLAPNRRVEIEVVGTRTVQR